jgi:hypothetical protein
MISPREVDVLRKAIGEAMVIATIDTAGTHAEAFWKHIDQAFWSLVSEQPATLGTNDKDET